MKTLECLLGLAVLLLTPLLGCGEAKACNPVGICAAPVYAYSAPVYAQQFAVQQYAVQQYVAPPVQVQAYAYAAPLAIQSYGYSLPVAAGGCHRLGLGGGCAAPVVVAPKLRINTWRPGRFR